MMNLTNTIRFTSEVDQAFHADRMGDDFPSVLLTFNGLATTMHFTSIYDARVWMKMRNDFNHIRVLVP